MRGYNLQEGQVADKIQEDLDALVKTLNETVTRYSEQEGKKDPKLFARANVKSHEKSLGKFVQEVKDNTHTYVNPNSVTAFEYHRTRIEVYRDAIARIAGMIWGELTTKLEKKYKKELKDGVPLNQQIKPFIDWLNEHSEIPSKKVEGQTYADKNSSRMLLLLLLKTLDVCEKHGKKPMIPNDVWESLRENRDALSVPETYPKDYKLGKKGM